MRRLNGSCAYLRLYTLIALNYRLRGECVGHQPRSGASVLKEDRRRPSCSSQQGPQNYGAAPAGVCSRAAFRNSQADMSQSAAKNPVRNKMSHGQLDPVEPDPAIRAITATNA